MSARHLWVAAMVSAISTTSATAHENQVDITRSGSKVCIQSNGTPDHDMGSFPNSGNPNSFRAQQVRYCFPADPKLTGKAPQRAQTSGVTLKGIPIRPGTADYYDASSPRGHSRDRSSGWNLEGMGAAKTLGMDRNAAHVDNRGLYHYHGISQGLTQSGTGALVGYAADGFEILYTGTAERSSWQLKTGKRGTAPYGRYDGTYVEDWQYVAGSGTLDECNGKMVNGTYTYFATQTFPFFPRCFKGTVSADFAGPQRGQNGGRPGAGMAPPPRNGTRPPPRLPR